MVEIETVYGSEFGFLKAEDITGPTKFTIAGSYVITFRDGRRRIVLILKGQKKHFVLNKTNAFALAKKFGNDTKWWVGKEITIETGLTTFRGKEIKTLLVK